MHANCACVFLLTIISLACATLRCPGGKVQCTDQQTCCQLSSGGYACCPAPKAVCCSDHNTCCPNGYVCVPELNICVKPKQVHPLLQKVPAMPLSSNAVVCPGGEAQCPDGSTCCKLEGGSYGCCPLPKAVCCADHTHCCPSGYTCDTSAGTCNRGNHVLLASKTQTAIKRIIDENVVCPDGQSECPSGNTCCKLAGGSYGCCPLPKAVCCADHTHCCPSGYTCDTSAGTCSRGNHVLLASKTQTAVKRTTGENVVCPDGQSECPSGNTCCKLAGGSYGCCPLPKAVCCADHTHCCPSGYTCDTSAGTCNRGNHVLLASKTQTALKHTLRSSSLGSSFRLTLGQQITDQLGVVVCPDMLSFCPDHSTCCKLPSGLYGCCPYPNAVCCSDGKHCCPSGYVCSSTSGLCESKQQMLSFVSDKADGPVVCPDHVTKCPSGSTCCKFGGSQYGCCPLLNAVCCSDRKHCCPENWICDASKGTCKESSTSNTMTWLRKVSAFYDSGDKNHNQDNYIRFKQSKNGGS